MKNVLLNPLQTRRVVLDGTYFGSHPDYPNPSKTLLLKATSEGVSLAKLGRWKNLGTIPWSEVVGFDFTGHLVNGLFTATLATTSGDVTIELQSLHAQDAGSNQMWAGRKQNKLNKFKRFVIKQTGELR